MPASVTSTAFGSKRSSFPCLSRAGPLPRHVPDHGGELHFLDDGALGVRASRRASRCGRMRPHSWPAGPSRACPRVRVGNVEPHAAGARRADLQVHLGRVLGGRAMQEAHVPDDLGRRLAEQQCLDVLDALVVDAFIRDPLPDLGRAVEDVLVAQACRGVHAVHDDIRPMADDLGQVVLLVGGLEVVVERGQEAADEARDPREAPPVTSWPGRRARRGFRWRGRRRPCCRTRPQAGSPQPRPRARTGTQQ